MSQAERSPTASPNTTGSASTSCSSSSGYHSGTEMDGSRRRRQKKPPKAQRGHAAGSLPVEDPVEDDFVMVELADGKLQDSPLRSARRRWSCSLPRVRFATSNPEEAVDIAMGESGLAAAEPITVGEMMQRTVVRVPQHVALRYKVQGGTWRDVTYKEYYQQCIAAAKSFRKVNSIGYIVG